MAKEVPTTGKPRDLTRTVTYAIVAVLVVVAAFVYMAPTPAPPAHRVVSTSAQSAEDAQITPADLTAHFPRYKGGKRDPFVPLISSNLNGIGQSGGGAGDGQWALTGISSINGTPNALLENGATGESIMLVKGESWRGLRVASIGSDSVTFEDAIGQQTHLSFNDTSTQTSTANLPSASQVTPLPGIGSLPPMPVPATAQPGTSQESPTQP